MATASKDAKKAIDLTAQTKTAGDAAQSASATQKMQEDFQEIRELCRARIEYLQEIIEWAKTASYEDLKSYMVSTYSFISSAENAKEISENLIGSQQRLIEIYSIILTPDIQQSTVDSLYIAVKDAMFQKTSHVSAPKGVTRKEHIEEWWYMSGLLNKLVAFISPELREIYQEGYLLYDDVGASFNFPTLLEKDIFAPCKRLADICDTALRRRSGEENSSYISPERLDHFYKIRFPEIKKIQKEAESWVTAYRESLEEEIVGAKGIKFTINITFEMIKLRLKIKQKIQPLRDEYQDFIDEIEQVKNLGRRQDILQQLISDLDKLDQRVLKATKKMITMDPSFSSEKVSSWSACAIISDGIRAQVQNYNDYMDYCKRCLVERYNFLLIQRAIKLTNDFIDGMRQNLEEDLTKYVDLYVAEIKNLTELKKQKKISPPPEQITSTAATGLIKTKKPVQSSNTVKKQVGLDEWKKEVEKIRLLEAERRTAKRREQIKVVVDEIALKRDYIKCKFELSIEKIKLREEKIRQVLSMNPTVQVLFAKLYGTGENVGSIPFGYQDLTKLLRALKTQKFNVAFKFNRTSGSHYTFVIRNTEFGTYHHLEGDESIEKAKMVKPHNTKEDEFSKRTIERLQATFSRAGFTKEVVTCVGAYTSTATTTTPQFEAMKAKDKKNSEIQAPSLKVTETLSPNK